MRDILDRLREDPGRKTLGEIIQEREAAAQEIERLRRQLAPLRVAVSPRKAPKPVVEPLPEQSRPMLGGKALLRLSDVCAAIGFSRSTVYNLIRQGVFPEPVHIGDRAVRWRAADIETWIEARARRQD